MVMQLILGMAKTKKSDKNNVRSTLNNLLFVSLGNNILCYEILENVWKLYQILCII